MIPIKPLNSMDTHALSHPGVADLAGELEDHFRDRGWTGLIWSLYVPEPNDLHVAPPEQFISSSAEQLMTQYREAQFDQCDPVVREVQTHLTPVYWTVDEFMRVPDVRQRELFGLVADQGFRCGISVPCFGPEGMGATFVTLSRAEGLSLGRVSDEVKEIMFFALSLFKAASGNRPERQRKTLLTPREMQCLQWVAQGKTSWETATILGISPRTVEFHLTNVMQKLDCHTRNQAIYEATRRNLFSLDRPAVPVPS